MIEPAGLRERPHVGKLPIPFVTYVDAEGRPDFRIHDNSKRLKCANRRLCQLCGLRMPGEVVFVGFADSIQRQTFGEPPMHRDCLDWAWEACPWLAGNNWRQIWREEAALVLVEPPNIDATEPLGIYTAQTFKLIPDREADTIKWVASEALKEIEWRTR